MPMHCFRNRDNWIPVSERIEILKTTDTSNAKTSLNCLPRKPQQKVGKASAGIHVWKWRELLMAYKICIDTFAGPMLAVIFLWVSMPRPAYRLAYTTHEPIGVVVAVSAFNHPLKFDCASGLLLL